MPKLKIMKKQQSLTATKKEFIKKKFFTIFFVILIMSAMFTVPVNAKSLKDKVGEGIEEFFVETLAQAVSGSIITAKDLLFFALDKDEAPTHFGDYSAGGLVTADPVEWEGGKPWENIKKISDDIIVPIAFLFFITALTIDLVSVLNMGSGFENAGWQPLAKWCLKMLVGSILITSIYDIVTWIFQIGVFVGESSIDKIEGASKLNIDALTDALTTYKAGQLLILLIISGLLLMAVFLIIGAIIITLIGRMIEIYMYISIAPIPMATFWQSDFKSVGWSWLKGILALAFQAFFVIIALTIFISLFDNIGTMINNGSTFSTTMFSLVLLLAFSLGLIFTIFRSGSISKSIFGTG